MWGRVPASGLTGPFSQCLELKRKGWWLEWGPGLLADEMR